MLVRAQLDIPRRTAHAAACGRPLATARQGIGVVELLVAIGILGVLAAIVPPAVQRARAAAHRLPCQNNLRQLIAALARYHDTHGIVPPLTVSRAAMIDIGLSDPAVQREFSFLCPLLPNAGREDLYAAINLRVDHFSDSATGYGVLANRTILFTTLYLFLGPADTHASPGGYVSYRGCAGFLDHLATRRGWPDSGRGVFHRPPIRFDHIIGGLAYTAALSERLVGIGCRTERWCSEPDNFDFVAVPIPNGPEQYGPICADLTRRPQKQIFPYAGRFWMFSGLLFTQYNHVLPPNSKVSECLAPGMVGAVSARSAHGSGVNVAFGNGYVRFVSYAIDLAIWRALGTRDGEEPIDDMAF